MTEDEGLWLDGLTPVCWHFQGLTETHRLKSVLPNSSGSRRNGACTRIRRKQMTCFRSYFHSPICPR